VSGHDLSVSPRYLSLPKGNRGLRSWAVKRLKTTFLAPQASARVAERLILSLPYLLMTYVSRSRTWLQPKRQTTHGMGRAP